MARMAVRLGVPIASLTSLAALLHPDVVELVIPELLIDSEFCCGAQRW
jgi:hypothetical protein